ncbi:hypothetical protein DSO57_1004929 [Entomophthora muscae]|uniref:Uncharacterized protein n=1 Tax=Entomophthora muscae TaxID=34485 RepID=A0ACC2T7Y3_9FUNG|nr:hypothetical protein DSO57_1004929 [Entomophthora muscae]
MAARTSWAVEPDWGDCHGHLGTLLFLGYTVYWIGICLRLNLGGVRNIPDINQILTEEKCWKQVKECPSKGAKFDKDFPPLSGEKKNQFLEKTDFGENWNILSSGQAPAAAAQTPAPLCQPPCTQPATCKPPASHSPAGPGLASHSLATQLPTQALLATRSPTPPPADLLPAPRPPACSLGPRAYSPANQNQPG